MNPSGGYDFEAVGDMGKDFECPICLLLIKKASELPCTHAFCKLCLEHWQANPMDRNAKLLCPSCKTAYQNHQVSGNKYVDKLVKTSLQVKCKESKIGCDWKGTILDYTDHDIKCSYKAISCNFVGCQERILRIDLHKHRSECPFRSVQCKHCKLEIQLIHLWMHYGTCSEYIVNCSNKGCSVAKRRKQISNHKEYECAYEVLDCKYESVGCKHKFQRQYTSEHEHEALPEHMNMLLNNVKVTSMELCAVKETLKTTEENLAATIENLEKTNVILHNTRKELQQTREDLAYANEKVVQSNKAMKEVKHHDHENDKFCFQVAKVLHATNLSILHTSRLPVLSTEEALQNLAKLECGLLAQQSVEFDKKYGEILHSPNQWLEFKKVLDTTIVNPKLYLERFKQAMDMMETNKLYTINDKETFVKIDVTQHKTKTLYFDYLNSSELSCFKKDPNTLFYSKEFVLYNSITFLYFDLPAWKGKKENSFLLNPMENISVQLPLSISEELSLNNMVLLKCVVQ